MDEHHLLDMGGGVWLTWGDDWNHDDYVINLTGLLAKHGLVIRPKGAPDA